MAAFQRPAVNWLDVTIQWPSGLKLPVLTAKKWPTRTCEEAAGAGAPDPSRVVGADRDELEAVRRVLRVVDELGVAVQRVEELSGRGVPELGDLAFRRRHAETARREDGVLGRDVDRAHELACVGVDAEPSSAAARGSDRRRSRGRTGPAARGAARSRLLDLPDRSPSDASVPADEERRRLRGERRGADPVVALRARTVDRRSRGRRGQRRSRRPSRAAAATIGAAHRHRARAHGRRS